MQSLTVIVILKTRYRSTGYLPRTMTVTSISSKHFNVKAIIKDLFLKKLFDCYNDRVTFVQDVEAEFWAARPVGMIKVNRADTTGETSEKPTTISVSPVSKCFYFAFKKR